MSTAATSTRISTVTRRSSVEGFFVRYEEHQEGSGNQGSLVAPFAGEHGWYWLNYNEYPVVVTLTVEGWFDDMIDYGIF